ncbi:MAG TPA: hypothetical protein VM911_02930 [Pyrinomonadaceae bacterium]|nr:hypothetical protein [Pyrinomonadaceae bacterium]
MSLCFCAVSATRAQSGRPPAPRPTPSPAPPPAAAKPPSLRVDTTGKLNGSVYTNEALGFTLTVPAGWEAQDKEVQQQFADSVSEKSDEILKDTPSTRASVSRTTIFLIAIKPTNEKTNPAVIGMIEDIQLAFSVRTPYQYLENLRAAARNTQLVFDDKSTTEQINGVEFGLIGARPKDPNASASTTLQQRYYVTMRKKHALVFIVTYDGDKQLQACMELLNSLKPL